MFIHTNQFVLAILQAFRHGVKTCKHKAAFQYAVSVEPKHSMLSLNCTTEQKILVTCSPITDTGKPAKLDGSPLWEQIDGNASLQLVNSKSAYLVSGEDSGVSHFRVTADADLGEGVVTIEDIIELSVENVMAKSLGLAANEPEAK